ncbi:hypothetical protein KUCAC02_034988 [Chaenocephalus aceratus]|nr:hypothetical protein KUCAC02_034988 [Chaenocephalus aceratus]
MDSALCVGVPPDTTQLCHISCPLDCFKLRKRRVSNEPTGGTGTCAHLVEAVPCEEPGCYDWLVLRLEDCTPDNERECGAGNSDPTRAVCEQRRYMSNTSHLAAGEFVERQLCRDAILPMPALCEVPCPKDCALSPWTSWTLCSNTCSGKNTEGKQTRARSILAYNAGEGGVQCPSISALQETGAWGQCIEDASIPASNASGGRTRGDDASCSVGMQTRKVICVRVNVGQLLGWDIISFSANAPFSQSPFVLVLAVRPPSRFVPGGGVPESLRPDTVRPCLLPCRRDCIVTPYSDWSACPASCRTESACLSLLKDAIVHVFHNSVKTPTRGHQAQRPAARVVRGRLARPAKDTTLLIGRKHKKKQFRKRIVIQTPANGGQDCPEVLSQEREC